MTNDEKLDKLLQYCIWRIRNPRDQNKIIAICKEITGDENLHNTEFRKYVKHLIDLGFANVYEDPIGTIEGEQFIGFVKESVMKKEIAERENKIAELTIENGRLNAEISKFQIEHYPFLLKEAKNKNLYFWVNLGVGGLLMLLGVILGARLKEPQEAPIVLPSIQIARDSVTIVKHDTIYLPDSLRKP